VTGAVNLGKVTIIIKDDGEIGRRVCAIAPHKLKKS